MDRTPLPGTTQKSSSRLGLDTVTRLNPETAAAFHASGYTFAARYVQLGRGVAQPGDVGGNKGMTRQEAEAILGAGLALVVVQFASSRPLTASLGTTHGGNAAANAMALGFPAGVTIFADVESVHDSSSQADVIAYINAWNDEVSPAGYRPGLYVGPGSKLTTDVLYSRLSTKCYWASAAKIANVDTRGWAMVQSRSHRVNGVHIDSDIARVDAKGGRLYWLAPTGDPVEPPCDSQNRCGD